MVGDDDVPITDLPLQDLVTTAGRGVLKAKPAQVFPIEQIVDAHELWRPTSRSARWS